MATLTDHLNAFDALADRIGRGPYAYARVIHHDGGGAAPHLVVGSMVHGDETGSLPAVVAVARALADGTLRYPGRFTAFVGNPEAGLADARFLEDDLNRVFVADPPDSHEGRRAREIRPILDDADVFLDLHQTILPTAQPFYIFPFGLEGWRWARAIGGARVWVTRHPGSAFSPGTCCADEYVRLRGRPGMTLELGEKGLGRGAEARAEAAVRRLIALGEAVGAGGPAALTAAADAAPELGFYETRHREPFSDDALALREGLVNFQPVTAGEALSAPGTPSLVAPVNGAVLFPKYPPRLADGRYKTPLPGEIYRIVAPLPDHPTSLWPDAC